MEYLMIVLLVVVFPFVVGWLNSDQVDPYLNPDYYKSGED